jgi:hypothetical protein
MSIFIIFVSSCINDDDVSPLATLLGKINEGDYYGARLYWDQKYIKGKIKKDQYLLWLSYINEREEEGYLDSLKIVEYDWVWETYSRDYFYIRGRVKNIGYKTIDYYKIKVLFYTKNKQDVLDMDYTNSSSLLNPGEAEKFEIMHKRDKRIGAYRVLVEEISLSR